MSDPLIPSVPPPGWHSPIFQALPDPVVLVDSGGRVLDLNAAASRLLPPAAPAPIGGDLHRMFHPAELAPAQCPVCAAIARGEAAQGLELTFPAGGRRERVTLVPLAGEGGQFALLHVARDLSGEALVELRARREFEALKERCDWLEREVAARGAEAESAVRELESFSYSVSHDLRGPLRAINGFSQALVEDCGEALDATGRDYLDRIARASRHLSELIDGLLVLSRVMRRELHPAPLDLSALAAESAARLRAEAPGRELEFIIEAGLTATADPQLTQLLLDHLFGNACKFSAGRERGVIEFRRVVRADRSWLCVRDNGVGFDRRFADKLFQPFQRLHQAAGYPGIGIGLATVRRIAQRHGGEVWADGEADRFAQFCFHLGGPGGPGAGAAPEAADEEQ